MSKTGFEKATSKMFGEYGAPVRIAQPSGGGRLSREEREKMREEAENAVLSEEGEQREKERREIVRTLVDMNVIRPDGGEAALEGGRGETGPEAEEARQGRGRPQKNPDVAEYVLMNFRVPVSFRQRIKVVAAERGKSMTDLFEEAFSPLLEKYEK